MGNYFFEADKDGKMSWEEYDKHSFAGDGGEEQKEIRDQDEKKFKFADLDGDKKLDLQEYHSFNHPGVSSCFHEFGMLTIILCCLAKISFTLSVYT